jgi:hypothetical protein
MRMRATPDPLWAAPLGARLDYGFRVLSALRFTLCLFFTLGLPFELLDLFALPLAEGLTVLSCHTLFLDLPHPSMEGGNPDISPSKQQESRILLLPLIEPATFCRSLPSAALRAGGKVSKKIHVGNLPAATTALDLSNMFGRFGVVDRTEIVEDRQTTGRRCFGIVEMATAAAASIAIRRLNLSQFEELTICVSLARA